MLYYLNYDGIRCSVFDSQIVTPLALLQEQQFSLRLINYEKESEIGGLSEALRRCEQKLGQRPVILAKLDYCNFVILARYIKQLCQVLRAQPVEEGPLVVHARGCLAGYIAIKARQKLAREREIKVITDLRGLISEEYRLNFAERNRFYQGFASVLCKMVARLEKYTARYSDALLCVSYRFSAYISNHFGVDAAKITVVPTCIDAKRFHFDEVARERLRLDYGWKYCLVVVYCGSAQSWQSPDLLFQTFLKLRQHRKDAKLLLISGEKALFEQYAGQYGLLPEEYRIVKAPYDEVNQYLSMADCALLLRKPDPVNEVASPTKFAEYLACRLPVIVTRNVGDLSDFVVRYQVGFFDDELDQLTEKLDQMYLGNYYKVIQEHFDWEVNLAKLVQIYRRFGL